MLNRLQGYFQLEKYTEKQVFHEKLTQDQAQSFLCNALQEHFRQYNGWDTSREYQIRISAKGRVLCSRKAVPNQAPRAVQSHNRKKRYLLEEGMVIQPLVDLVYSQKRGKLSTQCMINTSRLTVFLRWWTMYRTISPGSDRCA